MSDQATGIAELAECLIQWLIEWLVSLLVFWLIQYPTGRMLESLAWPLSWPGERLDADRGRARAV